MSKANFIASAAALALCAAATANAQETEPSQQTIAPEAAEGEMTVTLLGTGTPDPRIDRFGSSILVNVAGQNLLFDAGRGSVIRLEQIGVSPGDIDQAFLTHYHSDHINGLADLWLTSRLPPHGNRQTPFPMTGPNGLQAIADGLISAYQNDIGIREADEKLAPEASQFTVTEFGEDGVVYEKDGVRVTAFAVDHGELIDPSVGYRVDYGDHSVLLSGDTKKDDNLVANAEDVDLLIHEVGIAEPQMLENPAIQRILDHHTTPAEAGEVFTEAAPQLAVYSHIVTLHPPGTPEQSAEEILAATRATYDGPLLVGRDLMNFVISEEGVSQGFSGDPMKPRDEGG
ncbi:MAG: MBL fold metallo-hydrolase [Paracoccus denitrificans]|uniref:MBL fold metallo-hydrolase n=1 Tax=Paracoccus denitrificans TaxID=266 RepID=A0A533I2L4_PARDE|nr:MAG: MBL fold metallo-hydrolase [Paracoccus denitrificans]